MGEPDESDSDHSSSSYTDYYEDDEDVFVPYEKRPEWNDIKPARPYPWENKVLDIPYNPKFKSVHLFFRAIFKKNEHSKRALQLTQECISLNAANSTVWYFRRKCLLALNCNLKDELKYMDGVIIDSPKNYQVWHHRRWLIEQLKDPKTEKAFTNRLFSLDCKNYHAWQHRQWIVSQFSWWEDEIEFTDKLIGEDLRNNSAWNHRYFVNKRTKQLEDESYLEKEVAFAIKNIVKLPSNESSWNYLRGILSKVGFNKFPEMTKVFEELTSVHSHAFRIEAIEEKLKELEQPDPKLIQEALDLLEYLRNKGDVLRQEYWSYIERCFFEKYGSKEST